MVVADLWAGEQLTLFALRDWSREAGCTGRIEYVFRCALGLAQVEAAIASIGGMMNVLAAHARRPFNPYCAVCSLISPSEACVLGLVAAAQAEDEAYAAAAARWLVLPVSQPRLVASAGQFAACLRTRQLFLPARAASGCCQAESRPSPNPALAQARQRQPGFSKSPG